MIRIVFVLIIVGALGSLSCEDTKTTSSNLSRREKLVQDIRAELAEVKENSDVYVILQRALDAAGKTTKDEAAEAILLAARKQADEARRFRYVVESPLPEGWPDPSVPGLIRVKDYPPTRNAWVQASDARENRNSMFRVLFRHIQRKKIPMTSPVEMQYSADALRDEAPMGEAKAMAFLYRNAQEGTAGKEGLVEVVTTEPMTVVSLATKGPYSEKRYRETLAKLRVWLEQNADTWQASGEPRVLAYNSPFIPWWMKYSEVQVPIRQVTKE